MEREQSHSKGLDKSLSKGLDKGLDSKGHKRGTAVLMFPAGRS